MNILGLIASSVDPASRFRIIQYKEPLSKEKIELQLRFYTPLRDKDPTHLMRRLKRITGINEWRIANTLKSIARLPLIIQQFSFDIIWQNRLLLPYHRFFEKKYIKPFAFDYDDAIWLNEGEKQVAYAISKADVVFAGNEYLAGFGKKYNKNIHIIPTAVDTDILYPLNKPAGLFTIGWIGSRSNLPYLEIIRQPLLDFLTMNNDARLVIISTEKPLNFNFDNNRIIFQSWQPDKENEMINEFSVGIMPLTDDNYTRGKCSYKMLQYMACGKPVIVSPVGMNSKLLSESDIGFAATSKEDWLKALISVKNDPQLSEALGKNGTTLVESSYSVKKYAPVIAACFRKISGN